MMRRLLPLLLLLTIAAGPQPPIQKGLAQLDWSHNEDRAALSVTQWYAWGMGSCGGVYTNCTPMNRNFDMAAQTFCPPVELLGNEPTNDEPAGHPISATVAASVTVAIEMQCPGIKLVVANIHLNNQVTLGEVWNHDAAVKEAFDWLRDYLAAYKTKSGHVFTQTLGVHCYAQWAADCLARLNELGTLPYAGKFWLTEFAMYGAAPYTNGAELQTFLTGLGLMHRFERAYIWTNRGSWPFDLVNADGTLTSMGSVWANWKPPTVTQVWLPCINCAH